MSKRPPPDPVAVLRVRRMASCEYGIQFNIGQSRLHGFTVRHGSRDVASSALIRLNKLVSQVKDGTVKCWDIEAGGLSRTPSLTIQTKSYHFCKLLLVKKPSICLRKTGGIEVHGGMEDQESIHREGPYDDSENAQQNDMLTEGPKYMVMAGEQLSEECAWPCKPFYCSNHNDS